MSEENIEYYIPKHEFVFYGAHGEQESFKQFSLRIIIFLFLLAISFIGLYVIFFFIPDSWGIYWGDIFITLRFLLSIVISSAIIGNVFRMHFSQKQTIEELRYNSNRILQFFMYIDRDLQDKVLSGDAFHGEYYYDENCDKDIAIGFVLQQLRDLETSKYRAKEAMRSSLRDLGGYEYLYEKLKILDTLIMKHISEKIVLKYHKQVYSIRFNLMKYVFDTLMHGQFLKFEYCEDEYCYIINYHDDTPRFCSKYSKEDKPVVDFDKMILNIFYANFNDYKKQSHDYNPERFEKYFARDESDFSLACLDIYEEISILEESIKELEEQISDFRIEIQDQEFTLKLFITEYNTRVGIYYVKLDRITLRIEEYKHRIALVEGKTLTEEDMQNIEEEVNKKFNKERKRIDDLEDETTESSEEYKKYQEEEQKSQTFEEDFLKELKSLYHKLVFKFHPDMAKNEKQKKEFHKIFIAINEAYRNGDIETLRRYMKKIKRDEPRADEKPEEKLARLEKEYDLLLMILEKLTVEIEILENNEPYKLKEKVDKAKREGRDLLQELANDIKEKISRKQEELDELIAVYNDLIGAKV